MIDYIKLDITHVGQEDLLKKFTFKENWKSRGRFLYLEAHFHGLTIQINPKTGRIFLSGSLHKFYRLYQTGEEQNHDQFTFEQFVDCVRILEEHFGIDRTNAKLISLEVGLNIHIDLSPALFIERGLITYKGRYYSENADNLKKTVGSLKRWTLNDYEIKAYDKGLQYNLGINIFRWELKCLNHRFIRRTLAITNLWNLCELSSWERISEELIKRWRMDVLAIDWEWVDASLDPEFREYLLRYTNPAYWNDHLNRIRPAKRERKKILGHINSHLFPLYSWKDHILSRMYSTSELLYDLSPISNSDGLKDETI